MAGVTQTLEKLAAMAEALSHKPHLSRIGQLFSETVLVDIGGEQFFLTFREGAVVSLEQGPSMRTPWRFAFRASKEAMDEFWKPVPRPGYHDIFGLVKHGHGRIDGDILVLVKNLRFFKEFLALGRAGTTQ